MTDQRDPGPVGASPGTGRRICGTVDEMLSFTALATLTGRPVSEVRQMPFHSSDGKSGSHFSAVTVNGRRRYILKRISRRWDWVMRVTNDHVCRPIVAWQVRLLDRFAPVIVHGIVGCAADGDGWAILFDDFSDSMIPPGQEPITAEENAILLDSMAELAVALWGEPEAADPARGFCDLWHRYACFSPPVIGPEAGDPNPVPRLALEGWNLFPSLVDPSVAAVIGALHENVQPLVAALRRYPQTVVHGDWKLGNLGLIRQPAYVDGARRSPRVILLDWAVVGPAPPAAELAWYLALNSARLPVSKEKCIALYREGLSRRLEDRFAIEWWLPQLELCLLGALVQFGWEKALGAVHGESAMVRDREQAELEWWSQQARAGARWL